MRMIPSRRSTSAQASLEKDHGGMDGLAALLEAYDIRVLRPQPTTATNLARDVGVVIDDRSVATRMISDRAAEWQGIAPL